MAVHYICRYCRTHIGTINDPRVTESQLGFHLLSPDERNQILSYQPDGTVQANILCEHCQETIERYPEMSLLFTHVQ
ncbi:anti-sigma-F factor Fin family protein [Microaerobacter geothermalis]|uniref:anti-sigma-F factor Fin n=1 Tax=Microaerobacter geothermalis TaxID=674972 RepID=UPI001F1A1473|nr:anti-sigma-F factor Fin [Microaerobacter geothermalis]MCF6094698.1 anti-sigma-F factor Fin family protein [Microaerobacter geothermalis]